MDFLGKTLKLGVWLGAGILKISLLLVAGLAGFGASGLVATLVVALSLPQHIDFVVKNVIATVVFGVFGIFGALYFIREMKRHLKIP